MAWPTTAEVTALLQSAGLALAAQADAAGALAGAIAVIEKRTGRKFTTVTEARRYDGDETDWLFIHRCSQITAVERVDVAGTVIHSYVAGQDYLAYPEWDQTKTRLKKIRGMWPSHEWLSGWPRGSQNIQVSATFGEAVPDSLKSAALYQTGLLLIDAARQNFTGGVVSWKEDESAEEYGQNTLDTLKSAWQRFVEEAVGGETEIFF